MYILIFLGVISLIAIIATIVSVDRDGYRAQPTISHRDYLPEGLAAQPVVLLRLA